MPVDSKADLVPELIILLCSQCRRMWVGRWWPKSGYGICGATGPGSYVCRGILMPADTTDEFGAAMTATYKMGGWLAAVALLDQNPGWGWVRGAVGDHNIPQLHQPKCRGCGHIYDDPIHHPYTYGGHPFDIETA